MKKKNMYIVVLTIISIIITGCSTEKRKIVEYKEDKGFDEPNEVSYIFTGQSDNIAFETGKVLYGKNNERYILIKNFKFINVIEDEENIEKYSISLSFNGSSIIDDNMEYLNDKSFEEKLKSFVIEENGYYNESGYGEADAFLNSKETDFKKNTKMQIVYCFYNGDCKKENLKFNFFN